jgi:hypothetical protein
MNTACRYYHASFRQVVSERPEGDKLVNNDPEPTASSTDPVTDSSLSATTTPLTGEQESQGVSAEPRGFDAALKPLDAFLLGNDVYLLRRTQKLLQKQGGPPDAITKIIKELDRSLITLADEINPEALSRLNQVVGEMIKEEFDDDVERWDDLNALADRALAQGSPLRLWYELGRELELYEFRCDCRKDKDPLPDLHLLLGVLRRIPSKSVRIIPHLKRMRQTAAKLDQLGSRKWLQQALHPLHELPELPEGDLYADAYAMRVMLASLKKALCGALRQMKSPSQSISKEASKLQLRWDGEKNLLFYGEKVIRHCRGGIVAHRIAEVLEAFEKTGWPYRIEYPWKKPVDSQLLHNTIRSLNKGIEPNTIRFRADGDGNGIVCERPVRDGAAEPC